MNKSHSPIFTVIISTYNRSSALRIALQSVLDQTYKDFEVIVVGDGCTDDSFDIVKSLNDERVIWYNLPSNYGNQWAPNNFGLSVARGKYVTYLGHDDIWWPNHLELIFKKYQESEADIIASAAILYYPQESGMRAVTGFFPNDIFNPKYHFAPSSMSHTIELYRKIGGWRSPNDSGTASDLDFLSRVFLSGAKFLSTEEFTVFKFDASARRNVYLNPESSEQEIFYEKMRKNGEHFRLDEVTKTLRAATEDRLIKIEVPKGHLTERSPSPSKVLRAFKGTADALENVGLSGFDKNFALYSPIATYSGFEWHQIESNGKVDFRWSGPSRRSTIVFPEKFSGLKIFNIPIIHCINQEVIEDILIFVDDEKVSHQILKNMLGEKTICFEFDCGKLTHSSFKKTHLTIVLPKVWRPIDFDINEDRRWLGIAIGPIKIEGS